MAKNIVVMIVADADQLENLRYMVKELNSDDKVMSYNNIDGDPMEFPILSAELLED